MRYFRTSDERLVCEDNNSYYDLDSELSPNQGFRDLLATASLEEKELDEVVAPLLNNANAINFDPASDAALPLIPDEVWGAGVTYAISQESREGAGSISETYLNAYEAERPEVYFKATPTRTVGPSEQIGIRNDSNWDVPEPELAIILYEGDIVGYTIGNDVCSRQIERENLLYLPQSKIYRNSCSVGPCIVSPESVEDPHDLEMSMRIFRDDEVVFEGSTSTNEMVRSVNELTDYFNQCNYVPEITVLLTGTSIIPPDDVTLLPEDIVEIEIENIGTLRNPVAEVS